VASLLEVGTGFHPELTGRENIFLNGAILGMTRSEIKKKFDEIVDFAEIEKFLDTPVKRYSSGMYVRLAFAVAAHLEPEILLVDEVLAVGDAQFQKKCLGKMEEVSTQEGRTVLFVSHNMAAINNLCGSAIQLENGRFVGYGKTEEIVRNYLAAGGRQGTKIRHVPSASARVELKRIWTETCEGMESSDLDVTKPFKIMIEFDVRVRVTDVEIGVWVRNLRDIPIFFTNLSELNLGELAAFDPGLYVCSFQVPAMFLVPDGYRIQAKAHVPNVMTEDHIPHACEFNVIETGSALARYSHSWQYGVVLGNFEWMLSRHGELQQ
jgi:lipopolysaccharide transport system ATP-binding protein